jgi:tRNA pseudouridine55 synthase
VATRLTEYVQRMDKVYRARLLLGARSDTDDADGLISPVTVASQPDREEVARRLQAFVGDIAQVPPAFSAAKVTGRRAYDLARRGQEVDLRPRTVRIDAIDLLAYDYPHLEIEVRCGKGTYIRSMARDLGVSLGCGALVDTLRRTRIGPFVAEDALPLEVDRETARSRLLPTSQAIRELPRLVLQDGDIDRLRHGQSVILDPPSPGKESAEMAIFDQRNSLVAVADFDPDTQSLRPGKVLT